MCAGSSFLKISLLCVFTSLTALSTQQAFAQQLPGAADPGRIQQNIQPAPITPRSAEIISPDEEDDVQFELDLPKVKEGFTLTSVKVLGATVIEQESFDVVFKEAIGKKANLKTLQVLANRGTMLYRENGYFLSRLLVPEQEGENGQIVLAAVEGYASELEIRFPEATAKQARFLESISGDIRKRVQALRPLHSSKLQDILLRLNEFGGVNVGSVIEPLPPESAKPGAVKIAVLVQKTAPRFSVGFDTYGSRFSGPIQARANTSLAPGLFSFDRLQLNILTSAPTDEVKFGSMTYEVPVNSRGTFVGMNFGISDSEPGFTLKANEIESSSLSVEPYVRHPWVKTRKYTVMSQLSLDYRNIDSDILGTELFTDRIRALRLSNDVNYNDRWQGVNNANIRLSQGLNALGATESGSLNLSRAEGRSDFTKLEAGINRLQQLTTYLQLYTSVTGQYTNDPLLSTEEFGYGGQSFGRAYDPSEILGDRGVAGSIEFRYYGLPPVFNVSFSPFAFYDVGRIWNLDTGSEDHDSAASAGLGARYWHPVGISGTIGVAMPLTKDVNTPVFGNTDRDPRILFDIQYGF